MYPNSEQAMKMEIPLPCLYPSPFLNKPTHNFTSSSSSSSSTQPPPLSLTLSPLSSSSHQCARPSSITISPSFPNTSTSFSTSTIFDNSASIPLSLTPTHTPTHNQQHTQDGHLNTTHNTNTQSHSQLSQHNTQHNTNTHTYTRTHSNTSHNATIKSVLDSSIMATSMDIVRAWRHRRCIDVDFVLGCRTASDDAENVRYTLILHFMIFSIQILRQALIHYQSIHLFIYFFTSMVSYF